MASEHKLGEYIEGEGRTLVVAKFKPSVVGYAFTMALLVGLSFVVGPIIILLFGCCLYWGLKKSYSSQKLRLTDEAVVFSGGFFACGCCCWQTSEKVVTLEKITDLTLEQGCVERCFGIDSILVQTAGSANPQGGPELTLRGVVNSRDFKKAVLKAKAARVSGGGGGGASDAFGAGDVELGKVGEQRPLLEVRDTLLRIEKHIERYAESK